MNIKLSTIAMSLAVFSFANFCNAQQDNENSHQQHDQHSETAAPENLKHQMMILQEKMAKLEAILSRDQQGKKMMMDGMKMKKMGMNGKMGMGGMSGMKDDMSTTQMDMGSDTQMSDSEMKSGMDMKMMKGMKGGKMGMMGMEKMKMMGMKKMKMMGTMKDSSAMPSALPGFPGASHIYHIGSTDFFLDHMEHINLSVEQQKQLGQLREKSTLSQASLDRKIEEEEQELWKLTATDTPDIQAIEMRIRAIEKLKGDQRVAYIRAVGDAAKALTSVQIQTLTGEATGETGTDSQQSNHNH